MKDFRYLLFLFLFATLVISFGFIHKTLAVTADVTTLGGLSLDAYCNNLNQLNSNPINSSDWQCNPSGTKININKACQWQYNDPFAYGLQSNLSNPYTWQCFTSNAPPPTPKPTPIPTPTTAPFAQKELRIFDSKGNELGLLIDRTTFFYSPLEVMITLTGSRVGETWDDVYFENDCTGQPYKLFSGTAYNYDERVNELIVGGVGKYYTIVRGSGVTKQFNSFIRYSQGSFTCLSTTHVGNASRLIPVTLPFSEPIELPLHYKYQ